MKITNIRSEGLVERIINNGLTEDDKKHINWNWLTQEI